MSDSAIAVTAMPSERTISNPRVLTQGQAAFTALRNNFTYELDGIIDGS